MKIFQFKASIWVPRARNEVFKFFSNALNLEELTPPWLRFRVTTPVPIQMREGAVIDYRLRVRGFPVRWQSKITVWDPPHRLVDKQTRGPYRIWVHEHRFIEEAGGTLCEDTVNYVSIGGALLNKLLVERDIQKIFRYRTNRLQDIFGDSLPKPDRHADDDRTAIADGL